MRVTRRAPVVPPLPRRQKGGQRNNNGISSYQAAASGYLALAVSSHIRGLFGGHLGLSRVVRARGRVVGRGCCAIRGRGRR